MHCTSSIYGKKNTEDEGKDPAEQEGLQIPDIHSFWAALKGQGNFREPPYLAIQGPAVGLSCCVCCSPTDVRSLLNRGHVLQLYHCSVQVGF